MALSSFTRGTSRIKLVGILRFDYSFPKMQGSVKFIYSLSDEVSKLESWKDKFITRKEELKLTKLRL